MTWEARKRATVSGHLGRNVFRALSRVVGSGGRPGVAPGAAARWGRRGRTGPAGWWQVPNCPPSARAVAAGTCCVVGAAVNVSRGSARGASLAAASPGWPHSAC